MNSVVNHRTALVVEIATSLGHPLSTPSFRDRRSAKNIAIPLATRSATNPILNQKSFEARNVDVSEAVMNTPVVPTTKIQEIT